MYKQNALHDNLVTDKVCNSDHPTQVGFTHKFASC